MHQRDAVEERFRTSILVPCLLGLLLALPAMAEDDSGSGTVTDRITKQVLADADVTEDFALHQDRHKWNAWIELGVQGSTLNSLKVDVDEERFELFDSSRSHARRLVSSA